MRGVNSQLLIKMIFGRNSVKLIILNIFSFCLGDGWKRGHCPKTVGRQWVISQIWFAITRKVNFDHFRWKFEPKISVVRLDSGVAPFINLIKSLILKITIKSNKKSN